MMMKVQILSLISLLVIVQCQKSILRIKPASSLKNQHKLTEVANNDKLNEKRNILVRGAVVNKEPILSEKVETSSGLVRKISPDALKIAEKELTTLHNDKLNIGVDFNNPQSSKIVNERDEAKLATASRKPLFFWPKSSLFAMKTDLKEEHQKVEQVKEQDFPNTESSVRWMKIHGIYDD